MSIAELGSIAELVGAIGVIASLIYLATQVRGARSEALARNVREIFEGLRRTQVLIASEQGLAEIWQRGLGDYDSLPQADRLRFTLLLSDHILMFREAQIAHREGVLDDADYHRLRAYVGLLLNTPGGGHTWETHLEKMYSHEVTQELDSVRTGLPDAITYLPVLGPGSAESTRKPGPMLER